MMVMTVVVYVVIMYIEEEQNLSWFCFPICTLKMKSRYVITGPLLVLSTHSTDYFSLTYKKSIQFWSKKTVLL